MNAVLASIPITAPERIPPAIVAWRVAGDPAKRAAQGDWIDGMPTAEQAAEYNRLGLRLEFAYGSAPVRELAIIAAKVTTIAIEGADDVHVIRGRDVKLLRAAAGRVLGGRS